VGGSEVVLAADSHGCIPLHEACFKGNLEVVTILVDEGGGDSVRHVSTYGMTPLHSACFGTCPVDVVKLLIDRGGKEALLQTNNLGNSPLHLCCDGKASVEVVELLIDRGGEGCLEKMNVNGENALHYACLHNASVEVFELLVGKSSESDVEKIPGITITVILEWIQMQNESVAGAAASGMRTEGKSLFQSPFIQKILNDMFIHPQYLTVLMIDFYVQIMFVGIFSWGINDAVRYQTDISDWITGMLLIGILWSVMRELLQMATTPLKVYLHDGTEFFDWLQIGMLCLSLRILSNPDVLQDDPYNGGVLTVTTGLTWVLLIYVLGDLIPEIAIFVAALRRIIIKLIPFLVTTLLLVFGFAHMFYIANISHGNCAEIPPDEEISEDNWTCDLSANYFMALSMLLEGAHYYLVENPIRFTEPTSNSVLSIVFAFLIIIILLNILIAIISDVFSEVREKGTEEFWSGRYASMFELHRIYIGMGTCIKLEKSKRSGEKRGTIVVPPMLAATPSKTTLTTMEEKASESDDEVEEEEDEDEYEDAKDDLASCDNNSIRDDVVIETVPILNLTPNPTPKAVASSPLPDRFDFPSTLIKDTYFKNYLYFPEEERQFIEWWTGISTTPISFQHRMRYFISRSLLGDLIVPGKAFEKILRGMHRDQFLIHYLARIATYFIFLVVPLALFCLFVLGSLTLGLCWPKELREYLFFGSLGMNSTAAEDLVEVKDKMTDLVSEIAELKAVMYESKKLLLEQNDASRSRRE